MRVQVFFLTEGPPVSKRRDERSINLEAAVRFATAGAFIFALLFSLLFFVFSHLCAAGLTGVVSDVRGVLKRPDMVADAHKHGLLLATYGEQKYGDDVLLLNFIRLE